MASPPTRQQLKDAMLAIFLSTDKAEKGERSREFTKMLFSFVESRMQGKSPDLVSEMQMEAIGLFSQYVFKKNSEKAKESGKGPEQILREVAQESDELFDEIEFRIREK
ncbi:MAG: hypothetical protein QXH30_00305 [Candidatus Bilamarchaeaceae archaeon]